MSILSSEIPRVNSTPRKRVLKMKISHNLKIIRIKTQENIGKIKEMKPSKKDNMKLPFSATPKQ